MYKAVKGLLKYYLNMTTDDKNSHYLNKTTVEFGRCPLPVRSSQRIRDKITSTEELTKIDRKIIPTY